jgi:ADP-ribosylglycohydrolase
MSIYPLENSNYNEYLNHTTGDQYLSKMAENVSGAIIGAAIGDAAGVPYEVFGDLMHTLKKKTAQNFKPLSKGYAPPCTHNVPPGTWSDDTSMGLCLAMSMLHCGKFDQDNCAQWFSSWMGTGTLSSMDYTWGVGKMTNDVLTRYIVFEDLEKAKSELKSRPTNGCIMRNFPVACYFHNDLPSAIEASQKQTEITNWGKDCVFAIMFSCLQTEIIWKCLHNHFLDNKKTLRQIVEETFKPHLEAKDKFLIAVYEFVFNGNLTSDAPSLFVGSAFTSISYALCGLKIIMINSEDNTKTLTPPELYTIGLEAVILLGGDTDTNGCIYGGMAGAYFGFANLPKILVCNTAYVHFLKAVSSSITYHKDMITGNFVVDHNNKYFPNTAPKHTLCKPQKETFLFRKGVSYSMILHYFTNNKTSLFHYNYDSDTEDTSLFE